MAELVPVDHDPFAAPRGPAMVPVDHDPFAKAPPGIAEDIDRSIKRGVVEGVAGWLGGPADIPNLIAAGADKAESWITGAPAEEVKAKNDARAVVPTTFFDRFGSRAVKEAIRKHTPAGAEILDHQPVTRVGKYLRTMGEFAPSIPLGVRAAVTAALGSEAAGQATEGTQYEPYARIAAAVAAPAIAGRVVTPVRTAPDRVDATNVLAREGVELTAGQRTGSKPLQWLESTLGDLPVAGGRVAERMEEQGRQFNAAAARRMGTDADMLTPEVMRETADRLGQQFSDLAARNTLTADQRLVSDLRATMARHGRTLEAQQRQTVQTVADDVIGMFQPGPTGGAAMPGAAYQNARSELTRLASSATNPREAAALRGLRDALDNAMERSIAATNPADLGAWGEVRRHYAAMKTVEKAMSGAGEKTAQGFLSPQQLRAAVAARNGPAYVRGEGDLAELARAGAGAMQPLPQSGTAPRALYQSLATLGSGAVVGSGASPTITGATIAALAAPSVVGRVVMSRPGQAYLGNRVMPPEGRDRVTRALLASQRGMTAAGE